MQGHKIGVVQDTFHCVLYWYNYACDKWILNLNQPLSTNIYLVAKIKYSPALLKLPVAHKNEQLVVH